MKDREFEIHADAEKEKIAEQNRIDLQNEIAGREVGKQNRFGVGENLTATELQKKEEKERYALAAVMDLMDNPEYAALYNETKNFAHDLMRMTEEEITRANKSLEVLYQERAALLENSNKLDDGTIIFRDEHGNVFDENGDQIFDPVALESVVWKDGATTQEQFAANRDQIGSTLNEVDELTNYQVEILGDVIVKFDDENYRPDMDELLKVKEHMTEQAPSSIKSRLEVSDTSDHEKTLSQNIAEFKMN